MAYYPVGYHVVVLYGVKIMNLIITLVMFSLYLPFVSLFVKVFFEVIHTVALFLLLLFSFNLTF